MKGLIGSLIGKLGWVWFFIMWAGPFIMLGLAWFVPELHAPAAYPIADDVFKPFVYIAALGAVWLLAQILSAQNPHTTSGALQADLMVAAFSQLVLVGFASYMAGRGQLEYWMVIAPAHAFADLVINGVIAIRNALQKPWVQQQQVKAA